MKILVTGANGFIGGRLSCRLMVAGHQVFGLSQQKPGDITGFKDFYCLDISKSFSLPHPFDLVIHLAAYNITNIGTKDQDIYTAVNVEGAKNLLKAVSTTRVIYLSTAKIYKNQGLPLTEESPLMPQGAYEQSKLKAEAVCQMLLPKEELIILRSANVIGPGQAMKAVVPVFFQKARANQALDITNAAQMMQFVYVEDLIDAIEAVMAQEEIYGIFNIAYNEPVNVEQLARQIIALTHSTSTLNMPKSTPDNLFSPLVCDKSYQEFGWRAKTDLQTILKLYEKS